MSSSSSPSEGNEGETPKARRQRRRGPPLGVGRSVAHGLIACTFCRSRKLRCTGELPACDRCVKSGRDCVYEKNERFFQHIAKAHQHQRPDQGDDGGENGEENSSDDENKRSGYLDNRNSCERGDEIWSMQTTPMYYSAQSGITNMKRSRNQDDSATRLRITNQATTTTSTSTEMVCPSQFSTTHIAAIPSLVTEMTMADSATASFLMSIFTSRILPHYKPVYSLPDPPFFLSSFEQPASVAAAMQRDGALALACRNAGHEALAKVLIERMDRLGGVVKENYSKSYEGFSALVLHFILTSGQNASRAVELFKNMLESRREILKDGNEDIMESICAPLSKMNLSQACVLEAASSAAAQATRIATTTTEDLEGEDTSVVTPEEVEAHVQLATNQILTWTKTLEDPHLRLFVAHTLEMRARMSIPSFRPATIMQLAVVIDCVLLGLLVPPYLADTLAKHDSRGMFGLKAFFKPGVGSTGELLSNPATLPPEIASTLLRRCKVIRIILSTIHPAPHSVVVGVKCIVPIIHLRSGNLPAALRTAKEAMRSVVNRDLNFWPPLILQNIFLLAPVFFETGDTEGLQQIIQLATAAQRSIPSAKIAVATVTDLLSLLVTAAA